MYKGLLRKAVEMIGIFGQDKRDYELEAWRKFQAQEQDRQDKEMKQWERIGKNAIDDLRSGARDEMAAIIFTQEQAKKVVDHRYKVPKEPPKAMTEQVEDAINNTEIYRRVRDKILSAQHKQVAYGLDKYPEPLNADTWSHIETIDHIIDETIDQLHYLVMLRIKLEEDAEKELAELREEYAKAGYSVYTTLNPDAVILRSPEWMGGADMDGDYARAIKAVDEIFKKQGSKV